MARNYLPFIKRQRITIPAGADPSTLATSFSSIVELSTPGGLRTYLTDCYVYPDDANRTYVGGDMRIGVTGRSYNTAEFYPNYTFYDGTIKETGCWRFAKPYRIFPGDRLKVRETYPSGSDRFRVRSGVVFSGIRISDNTPILIYQTADEYVADAGAYLFDKDTMKCPDDSPVDLYAIISNIPRQMYPLHFAGLGTPNYSLMVWGPDGRQWWDDPTWTNLLFLDSHVIDLNKPEWVMDPEETLVFEFRYVDSAQSDLYLWITIRGSYEVEV